MSLIKVVGIDLAKLVFSIHGVDKHDKCKLRKTIKRNKLLEEITQLPQLVGIKTSLKQLKMQFLQLMKNYLSNYQQ